MASLIPLPWSLFVGSLTQSAADPPSDGQYRMKGKNIQERLEICSWYPPGTAQASQLPLALTHGELGPEFLLDTKYSNRCSRENSFGPRSFRPPSDSGHETCPASFSYRTIAAVRKQQTLPAPLVLLRVFLERCQFATRGPSCCSQRREACISSAVSISDAEPCLHCC